MSSYHALINNPLIPHPAISFSNQEGKDILILNSLLKRHLRKYGKEIKEKGIKAIDVNQKRIKFLR